MGQGGVGLATAVWLAYATVMAGFLGSSMHAKSNVDLCVSGAPILLTVQVNDPGDFVDEKAQQYKIDGARRQQER